ncbi:MAG: hypothetical protein LBL47_01405 [Lactobacillus sp.]|jgi:hypothetical protein|nr:hypothetical protein [Lactobacillus sp.]
MIKRALYILASTLTLSSCVFFADGKGQVIYHWERENTGIEKFSRDHSECMRLAEDFKFIPDVRTWFYSEEVKLNVRADWHSEKGIWASYVPYPGATPVTVNALRKTDDASPRKYRLCMERRGYWHRTSNIPTTTNIYIYRPQNLYQYVPFKIGYQ